MEALFSFISGQRQAFTLTEIQNQKLQV